MYLSIMCSVKAWDVSFSLNFWLSESMHELESDPIQILFFLFEVQPYQIIVSHWLIEKKY